LEVVASVNGVTYINDSIATSPERSMAGLRAIEQPIVLIAGGRDKHLPMDEWAQLINARGRAVVLVGEAAGVIGDALARADARLPIVRAAQFADTVPLAADLAQPGDVVLLSPGCTSFDSFVDYEARGEAFRHAVTSLAEASQP
jgi:UDP-N-acetylmuramoylalanine--D-glutamate ligase